MLSWAKSFGKCRRNVFQLLRELHLHPFKGEKGNKNCIHYRTKKEAPPSTFLGLAKPAQPWSWVQTLGPSCLTELTLRKRVSRSVFTVSQPLYFLGLCLSQHLLLILWSSQNPAPQLSSALPPGLPLQPSKLAGTDDDSGAMLTGYSGAALGAQVLPQLPGTILRGTECLPGRAALLSTPFYHHSPHPIAKAGKVPSAHGLMGHLQRW